MTIKSELRERKYFIMGVVVGALSGFIGSLASGYHFWIKEHPEDTHLYIIYLAIFFSLILVLLYMIHKLSKK